MLSTAHVYSQVIAKEFGLDKCTTLTINKGKRVKIERIKMFREIRSKVWMKITTNTYLCRLGNIKNPEVKKKNSSTSED